MTDNDRILDAVGTLADLLNVRVAVVDEKPGPVFGLYRIQYAAPLPVSPSEWGA